MFTRRVPIPSILNSTRFQLHKLYKCRIHHLGKTVDCANRGDRPERRRIVQASLSRGQRLVQQCNPSVSAHWDYFTFFPFFSCNFFCFSHHCTMSDLSPLAFPARRLPPPPLLRPQTQEVSLKTLKCVIRMKPGGRRQRAPVAPLLHTTHTPHKPTGSHLHRARR